MNKTADILPKFQTDYMFIRTVEESVKTVEIAQKSCDEQDGGYFTEIPDGLHVHSNGGGKCQNS